MVDERLETFLEACGADGPLELRVVDAGGNEVDQWSIPRPFAVIGRDSKAEIRLEHEQISRRHAYLQVLAGQVLCADLQSRAGIAWNSVYEPSGWLGHNGVLGVGPYRIQVVGAEVVDGSPSLPPPLAARTLWGDAALPRAALDWPTGGDGHSRHELGRVVNLMGRARGCRLRIHDESVSQHHCALLRTPKGLFVVDLLSREGTWVNGSRVRWSRLDEGDRIEIGRFKARIVPGSPSTLPAVRGPQPLSPVVVRSAAPAELVRTGTDEAAIEALFRPYVAQFDRMQEQMFGQFQQSLMAMLQLIGTLHRDQMAQVRQELDRIGRITEQLQAMQAEAIRAASAKSKPEPASGGLSAPEVASTEPASIRPSARPPLRRRSQGAAPEAGIHEMICRRVAELQEERQGRMQSLLGLLRVKGDTPPGTAPAQT